jgi:hypothetical protein
LEYFLIIPNRKDQCNHCLFKLRKVLRFIKGKKLPKSLLKTRANKYKNKYCCRYTLYKLSKGIVPLFLSPVTSTQLIDRDLVSIK